MTCLVGVTFVPGTENQRAALLPAEQAHVRELMKQGVMETGYLAADLTRAWMILRGESREQVEQTMTTFPFYPFMELELTPLADIVAGNGPRAAQTGAGMAVTA
jgi:muconolactone delta-isomerase